MIVALDGPDGAGKSTQVTHVIGWAHDQGMSVQALGKWQILDTGRVPLARFLRGTSREELRVCIAEMPSPARMMFLAWMNSLAVERAKEATEDLVVLDGYWIKHAASELLLGCDPVLVDAITKAIRPVDLVVYVDVTPEEALRRKDGDISPYECGADLSCDPGRFLSHQAGMREVMVEWAQTYGWSVIDAGSPATMNAELTAMIMKTLHGAL